MKARSWVTLGITVLLIVAVSYVALFGVQVDKYILKPVSDAISLGLDLRGGISTEYVATDTTADNFDELMDGTVEVLRSRLTGAGFTEANVARQGGDRIRVEIPDVSDPEEIVAIIGKPAHLEFRNPEGEVLMEGKDIEEAYAAQNNETAMPVVAFKLTGEGKTKFAKATASLVGSTLSIYLDDELISAPTVNEPIPNGEGVISFSGSGMTYDEALEEAQNLSMLIMSGALPLDIEESETRAISATLGIKAIDGALIAGLIGLALVIIFMIVMYRLPGVASALALCIYVLIVFYALAITGAQLTLQGIAGILLGIGMAVDANVIIFERFREELKAGRTPMNALTFGYKNALSAIIDSNVTTIIAAAVLLWLGTGTIKGFATTLLIGVIASLLTAVFVTKFLCKQLLRLGATNNAWYTR